MKLKSILDISSETNFEIVQKRNGKYITFHIDYTKNVVKNFPNSGLYYLDSAAWLPDSVMESSVIDIKTNQITGALFIRLEDAEV